MVHLQKGAFKDVSLKIKFNMLEEENIKPLVRRMKSWLMNGKHYILLMMMCIEKLNML